MERQPISLQDYGPRPGNQQPQQSQPTQPVRPGTAGPGGRNMLLSIAGAGASIEGTFHIADSIEIECEVRGEMIVGGRLLIGENAVVSADVQTVDAVIMGRYSGNLRASGSIEITSSGRVSGNMETNELVVAKGGIFTGNVTRPGDPAREQPQPLAERQEPVPQSQAGSRTPPAQPEPTKPDPSRQSEKGRPSTPSPRTSGPTSQDAGLREPLTPATDRQSLSPAQESSLERPDGPNDADETPPRQRSSKPRSWS